MSVRDLGSSNGTFINRNRLEDDQDFNLRDGDLLTIGDTDLRFKVLLPVTCDACGVEIPDESKETARLGDASYICFECREQAMEKSGTATRSIAVCCKCGAVECEPGGAVGSDTFICTACRNSGVGPDSPYKGKARPTGIGMSYCNFGNLELKEKLGQGGMGVVYRAYDAQRGHDVALKVLTPELAQEKIAVRSFMREIQHTRILDHPNIVSFHDVALESDTVYYTMEYCDAGSLQKLLAGRDEPLGLERATELFMSILDALEFAHTVKSTDGKRLGFGKTPVGIIHRDLKPGNIFLAHKADRLAPKVGDFGISKALSATGLSQSTCTGTAFGTPAFMPRWQMTNFKEAGFEVDVWAAVAIFYYMLTKRTPRHIDSKRPLHSLLNNRIIPIQALNKELPSSVAMVIDTALEDTDSLAFDSIQSLRKELIKAI